MVSFFVYKIIDYYSTYIFCSIFMFSITESVVIPAKVSFSKNLKPRVWKFFHEFFYLSECKLTTQDDFIYIIVLKHKSDGFAVVYSEDSRYIYLSFISYFFQVLKYSDITTYHSIKTNFFKLF